MLDDASVERLREMIWQLTGLMRVYLRDGEHPVALRPPATVVDVADAIHHDLGLRCTGARVWGLRRGSRVSRSGARTYFRTVTRSRYWIEV